MPCASDFRKLGRDALKGNWPMSVLVVLLAIILGAVGFVSFSGISFNITIGDHSHIWLFHSGFFAELWWSVYSVVVFIIGSAVELGLCSYFISLQRRKECGAENLFHYFSVFGRAILLRLYIFLLVFLWSLLLIVPGIVAAYRYSMAPYLMSQNPQLDIEEAVALSSRMTYGHKGRLFCLDLSFIGWIILGMIPFGAGMLLVAPYMLSARAAFFLDLQYRYLQNQAA